MTTTMKYRIFAGLGLAGAVALGALSILLVSVWLAQTPKAAEVAHVELLLETSTTVLG